MQQLEKAWHRPGFELTLYGNYNLFDKLAIELDIFYISGIIARDYTVKDRQKALKEIIDLNLSATYKITDRLSSYLYLYNILNQNYYRYNNYQSKGINVLLGITYAF